MERYELIEGTSSKFWEVWTKGAIVSVRFGRIGTNGQTKDKDFASADVAEKEKTKLVKEKTGKGYVLVGSGNVSPPPPSTAKAEWQDNEPLESKSAKNNATNVVEAIPPTTVLRRVAPSPSETDELQHLLKKALPTRSRPGEIHTPAQAWTNFRLKLGDLLKLTKDATRVAWFQSRVGDDGPVGPGLAGWLGSKLGGGSQAMPVDEALEWIEKLQQVFGTTPPLGWAVKTEGQGLHLAALRAFGVWYGAMAGGTAAAEVALRRSPDNTARRGSYQDLSWADPFAIAWRSALVNLSEAEYGIAVEKFIEGLAPHPLDWGRRAFAAFLLADDRTTNHELKPQNVIQAAQASGLAIGETLYMVPLVLDSPPDEVARHRSKRSYYFYMVYCQIGPEVTAATAIAVARHYGQASAGTLDWLLHYANDAEKTDVAGDILAVDEPSSLTTLLPLLHDKWIRAAVDKANKIDPGRTFRQILAALGAGRNEPVLKARAVDTIGRYKIDILRGWAESDPKALAQLERMLAIAAAIEAPADAIPAVLAEPPWRTKTKQRDDIVVKLEPIATPFAFKPLPSTDDHSWRYNRDMPVDKLSDLIDLIGAAEANPKESWHRIPDANSPLPTKSDSEEYILSWLSTRLGQLTYWSSGEYRSLYDTIERLPDAIALAVWESRGIHHYYYWRDCYAPMIERFGERALLGAVKLAESDPAGAFEQGIGLDAPELAPIAARAVLKLKKARVPALAWLRRHRKTAIKRLIPDAVGKIGASRDAAEYTLRWYASSIENARAEIDAAVVEYAAQGPAVQEAVEQVLTRDPLSRFPAKRPGLPSWLVLGVLTSPELKSGGCLPDSAKVTIAEMLAFSTPDAVYPGVEVLKHVCTSQSLAAFSWDLFSAWLAEGAPSKDGWTLRAVGWLGDDECARQLTRLIRRWPGEAAHQRAVTGLDVLADIGSDVALMNLNGIAEKVKFKGLQERAREKIATLAEARELTPEELADRLAPDLDLDERGGLDIEFGERKFRAGFDEFLKPWVKDHTGLRLKDLPKPNKSDDPDKSKEASARWAALKKDARAVASLQITRLENMLSASRRTPPATFWTFFAAHPLIRHLTQRLVWGVYADADPRTAPTTIFRVADDLSLTDARDEPQELDFSDEAKGLVGLVHPLHLPAGGLDAWGALFGDYEISQPFPQLGRETYALNDAEKAQSEITRFEGVEVESPRLRGMPGKGWELGSPQDGGGIWWIERKVKIEGKQHSVLLDFHEGLVAGGADFEEKFQKLGKLSMNGPYEKASTKSRTFGELDPVTLSELLRGPAQLAETGKK
ncbi:DUF4132 domain-containing protein [Labrys neptuniae]|uniref:WGR and DUF4132 domain-containing protein n=1 Tax=Labrys neptuniae TaxID=376174 RepID=UPI00288D8D08|nr:DUF4132 domain-containing protein [Labrys neptuniae]MDT3380044.1 DUF4132 domain-containing protein [Labrys neptuniae]